MNLSDIRKDHEQLLFKAVASASCEETAQSVVYNGHNQPTSVDDATWVTSTMHRLEKLFDGPSVKKIRMACQCSLFMDEKLALVKELLESSSNMYEFANQARARAAGLFSSDGKLFLQFPSCPCPMLADVERLESSAWCQCTTGYSKVLFEKAFGCEVSVELLEAVKMGDDRCLMEIIPHGSVWK